jgi:hypothetical protein
LSYLYHLLFDKHVRNPKIFSQIISISIIAVNVPPVRREGGLFLWDRMLQYGAARDTKVMLAELSGGPLQAHHFMNTL